MTIPTLTLWVAMLTSIPANTCPFCRLADQRSTVEISGWMTCTLLAGPRPYYDEDGHLHIPEDPNICTQTLSCSRGHSWERKGKISDLMIGDLVSGGLR